jgi:hypothetical protein
LQLWQRLGLAPFCEATLDGQPAEVPWSRIAAILAINRLCAPGSELAIEARWYASTALDDLLGVAPERREHRPPLPLPGLAPAAQGGPRTAPGHALRHALVVCHDGDDGASIS